MRGNPVTRRDTHNGMIFGRTCPDCHTLIFGGCVELSFCLLGSGIGLVLVENWLSQVLKEFCQGCDVVLIVGLFNGAGKM